MQNNNENNKYLSALGAWALAFGCAVGWGSFVMPGTTFLPLAGPYGSALGIAIGGAVMLVLGYNYHYLINIYPEAGGTYTYTKKCFGYDHGFINAWFLILTYIAIIWANATALPLIARNLLGGTFQHGFTYQIAGFQVYFGEIMLAIGSMVLAAFICMRRSLSQTAQIIMAVVLISFVTICFIVALVTDQNRSASFDPPYSDKQTPFMQVFTVFALAPWAFVGFESISHSAAEAKYPLKRTFFILSTAIVAAAAAYIFLDLLAVTAIPAGLSSWSEYISSIGTYSGLKGLPTFYAVDVYMGKVGRLLLGIAAVCGIFTGLVGNFIALSRLLCALSDDGMFHGWLGKTDRNRVPKNAILAILFISVLLPFLGRTAVGWIVDVTTVGATIAYAFASAAAVKTANVRKNAFAGFFGVLGLLISLLFAVAFLIPNVLSITTLSPESYIILAAWAMLGFLFFRRVFRNDRERRYGRSIVAWVVLLGLVIFTSSIWMLQENERNIENSAGPIQEYYQSMLDEYGVADSASSAEYIADSLGSIERSVSVNALIQMSMIVFSIMVLLNLYSSMQKREKQMEIEKGIAEESSRAKSSFLSNMSHEIRTPMNAIIGLDNIALREPDLSPATRDHLEKIGQSARHLLGLINDILDMSRIESGRMVLKNEEFLFSDLLDQVNIMINGQCQDKGISYEHEVTGSVRDYYVGDDMKLKQVLINILGNSVKFTEPPGSVRLSVEALGENDGKALMRFVMQDTGIGMDKEFIPKIFESFAQEDATSTNKYGGSGLGMAITKNFVDMMGGNIHVESEKGKGSTFTVTVELETSDRQAERDAEETAEGRSLAGMRVLIAEDVDLNAEILSDLLELEEVESERAGNGEIAVRMFSEKDPGYYDAVLMDVRMPVMDGYTATAAIRALERADAKTVPIIAMTANAFEEDVEHSLNAGMNGHLSKPIEPDMLYAALGKLVPEK